MACVLTKGRKVPCKSGVGGLKSVYFADFGGFGAPHGPPISPFFSKNEDPERKPKKVGFFNARWRVGRTP